MNKEWIVNGKEGFSKSHNCIFDGKKLKGKAMHTIVNGAMKYSDGQIIR